MYNYGIKTNFVSPETPKTGYNTIRYMIVKYGVEPVLIQWLLINFEAILENFLMQIVHWKYNKTCKDINSDILINFNNAQFVLISRFKPTSPV